MELEFMEIEFQNTTIGLQIFFIFLFSVYYNSIVQKLSFELKFNF